MLNAGIAVPRACGDAHVVVQDIESAKVLTGGADRRLDLILVSNVDLNGDGFSAGIRDGRHRVLCGLKVTVGNHDARACVRECERHRPAIADGRARCLTTADHERGFIVELHRASL